jgi:diguanylate cyclase (GGDEF)-like protein
MILRRFEELRYGGALPTSSGVGLSILRLTQHEAVAPTELARVIRCDPALSGRILRLANIARTAGSPAVGDVESAAAALAPATLRSAALSFALLPAGRTAAGGLFDHDVYWSYTLACACAAEVLAAETQVVEPRGAYACALLSRIGMLALATVHAESFERILAETRGRSVEELLLEEREHYDIQHWEVSAAILLEWGLPEEYAQAVLALGLPRRDPELDEHDADALADLLRTASLIAQRLLEGAGLTGSHALDLYAPTSGALMDSDRLAALSARAAQSWRAACERQRLPCAGADVAGVADAADAGDASAAPDCAPSSSLQAGAPPGRARSAGSKERLELEPSALRVLVVDDDPRMLRWIDHHLRAAGYGTTTAPDGATALRLILEDAPHILLTDWRMPGMDGGELLRRVRATDLGRRIYCIVLTARDEEAQVVEAFDVGADDFVAKPCNPRVLMARVGAAHRTVELQRRVQSDRERRSAQVAEMGLMTRKLHAAAHTDVLTELPNRRYAMERLEQAWSESERLRRPISVLIVDIDHFKSVNDRLGHDVGDQVLRSTAAVLRQHTRRADVVCRLGGEEFLVINVDSDEHGAGMCAERLRSAVEANVIRAHGHDVRVTISVGLATRQEWTLAMGDLLKAADEAVYAAKAAGRNVVRASPKRASESA